MPHLRLKHKLIIVFLLISIIPIDTIVVYIYKRQVAASSQAKIEAALAASKLVERQIPFFFEIQQTRVADWSSDGHIRTEVAALIKEPDKERATDLSIYLKEKKKHIGFRGSAYGYSQG